MKGFIVVTLIVLWVCMLVAMAGAAEARPHHRHHHTRHHASVAVRDNLSQAQIFEQDDRYPSRRVASASFSWGGGGGLVSSARRFMGSTAGQLGLPSSLWCADFMNMVMRQNGYRGTGSRAARSYLALPHTAPSVGAIAVLSRGRGSGHVGVVTGFSGGNPIVVSGNHGRRVGEGVYPRQRVLAYVSPR